MLQAWPTLKKDSIYSNLWISSPSILIWELWKECNRRIFQDEKLEWKQLCNKIEASIIENSNCRISKCQDTNLNMSHWDGKMRGKWIIISLPPFIGSGNNITASKRAECKWKPLKEGWFKLNFDGASRGNPEVAGIGCCVHKNEGKEIATISKSIGIETNNWAELYALVQGLSICASLGLRCLEIEGDSAIIINALRKGKIPNWRLNSLLLQALNLCYSFKEISINHIYREGNRRADELANLGADKDATLNI